MQLNQLKKSIQAIAVLLGICIYFSNAQTVINSVMGGLSLCYNVIIPSLFIFMVICEFISGLDCCEYLALPFMPYFRLLNIDNRKIASWCILGILGGFATGALMLDKINKHFKISRGALKVLSVILSMNSPSFVILAVGLKYMGNIESGIIIYLSCLLSSLITAFFISVFEPVCIENTSENVLVMTKTITNPVKSSTNAIICVCGVVTVVFTLCKVLSLYINNSCILSIFSVFTEVTTACEYIFSTFGKNIYLLSLTVFLTPLSAYLQLKSEGNNNEYNIFFIVWVRILQLPLSFLILRTILNLFPAALTVYADSNITINPYWNSPRLSFCLFIISFYFTVLCDKKIGVFTIPSK
ncbi:MAG: hypothetical protein IJN69_04020 [Oscillospiraceae bacterium]|nr:hypothetical protein [Oscillospiraceae bacterium]